MSHEESQKQPLPGPEERRHILNLAQSQLNYARTLLERLEPSFRPGVQTGPPEPSQAVNFLNIMSN